MPRSSFTSSFLRGATPGLGRLAQAVGSGRNAYQDAYTKEEQAQSRIAQAVASQHASQAKADQDNAETAVIQGRPQVFDRTVSARAGVSIPQVQAFRQFQDTGVMPEKELPGPTDEMGNAPGSAPVLDEAMTSKIGQLIGQLAPVLLGNVKDNKPDDLARADQIYGDDAGRDRVLSGALTPGQFGAAQAARGAKPLFHSGENGAVLDQYGGGLDTGNPMAQSTIGLRGAQASQAKAGAAENYAQAGAATATAGLRRAQTGAVGSGGAGGKAPAGYRWGIDPATAEPVLEPIKGGPADPVNKGPRSLNGEQANALTFASRMQAAQEILDGMAAKGVTRGSLVKQGVEAVPLVGAAAGMVANNFASEGQQQVEQAQRDFINAVLRRESGAAISMGEFANAQKQYFDQPNDKPAVREQKRQARQRVINGMLAAVPENLRAIPNAGANSAHSPSAPRNIVVDY